jgi:hypothetical protein
MAEMQDLEVEASELEVVEQQDTEREQAAEVAVPEDDIPEEFKGMSAAELARVAKHARTQMGKQANELGEIRKLADELIKSQLKPKQPEPEPVKEVDFFENPQEAIRRAVETNPHVQQAQQFGLQAIRAQAQQRLAQLHPDFGQIVQDAEFAKWVGESKKRVQMFREAEAYDLDSAHELLSTFKQLRQVRAEKPVAEVPAEEKASRTKTLQSASVDTGGSGESSKKVYRRADLIRLKMRDPAKYEDMADEILKAYGEGRVR